VHTVFVDFRKAFDVVIRTIYYTINAKSTAYPTSYYCGMVPIYQIVNRESVLTSLYLLGSNSVGLCSRV